MHKIIACVHVCVGGQESQRTRLASTVGTEMYARLNLCNTVEPPNRGHFGTAAFVLSSEVVLFSEVV